MKNKIILLCLLSTCLIVIISRKTNVSYQIDDTLLASNNVQIDIPIICLDAGHGGEDVGALNDERLEKEDCLALTLLTKTYLEQMGFDVILTRETDVFLGNSERAEYANSYQADVMVSIHRNDYSGLEEVNGVEAWINDQYLQEDVLLAENILFAIQHTIPETYIRGVKGGTMDNDGNYAINRVASMPSCILEVGFMSSDNDNDLFDTYIQDYAYAIAYGIQNFMLN